ncbi:hypothetical protein BASA50_010149 [Batrachochytrium salamandrivorans]|uniref:Uncharacterized protein n=1 Tax=Batrachochytrium salamandrivorans TaxID=1357716 RepID=A0ABQ8EZC1_9FUNG|nr:hypothetical protein BASA60_007934 [Batrachochytrium salamandrivorans]KAH6589274.1 hypothetical protein BASA50_010149 [Batrachochytrium salamandrivorans]KAH6590809.1 hypothetical protein BASA61_005146 [Batrachochytrium salamandrivorans]KAH9258795.1 hypothetical protein BASA81_002859 [Batrachochytrium salamandrivorans]KAJ1343576.1 hypothetical protein BSLG_001845 [Batrachochytrium salamandrivorans]
MSQISIELLEGVTGGIMAPRLRRRVKVDFNSGAGVASVERYIESNEPSAVDGFQLFESGASLSSTAVHSLVNEAVTAFQSLPIEDPPGSIDLYHMDTTIMIEAPGFRWRNTPNQGCSITPTIMEPTSEQLKIFKSFVKRINAFADEHALVEGQLD